MSEFRKIKIKENWRFQKWTVRMIVFSVGRRILSQSLGTIVNRELSCQSLRFCLNESTFVGSCASKRFNERRFVTLKYKVTLQTGNWPKWKRKLLLPWNLEEFKHVFRSITYQLFFGSCFSQLKRFLSPKCKKFKSSPEQTFTSPRPLRCEPKSLTSPQRLRGAKGL